MSQRTQSLPGPLQWWPGAVGPLAGKGVSDSDSCDNSIVRFVGKTRVFFLYSYIIDTFYLLVVNYCCCLVRLKLPGCWASVYMCTPSPTCLPHLGGWWPAVAKKPKIFSFFSFSDTVLRFWRGEGRHSSMANALFPQLLPGAPALSSAPLGAHNTFFKNTLEVVFFFFLQLHSDVRSREKMESLLWEWELGEGVGHTE